MVVWLSAAAKVSGSYLRGAQRPRPRQSPVRNPAAGLEIVCPEQPRFEAHTHDGEKDAHPQMGIRLRIRRRLDGLQRRFAPSGTVANQRGSHEFNDWGKSNPGALGVLASSRLAGSLLGMEPGTRGLRLRILQALLRTSLALALFVRRRFWKPRSIAR